MSHIYVFRPVVRPRLSADDTPQSAALQAAMSWKTFF